MGNRSGTNRYDRRDIFKGAGAIFATSFLWPASKGALQQSLQIASRGAELQLSRVSPHTFRLSVLPIEGGQPQPVKGNGSLVQASWGPPLGRFTNGENEHVVKTGELNLRLSLNPLKVVVQTAKGEIVQQLTVDHDTGIVSFRLENSAILGLG